MRAFGAAHEQ
jgi:hypothetical protein